MLGVARSGAPCLFKALHRGSGPLLRTESENEWRDTFEAKAELDLLRRLLNASFERARERIKLIYGNNRPIPAKQLAGSRRRGSPPSTAKEIREAPCSVAFLHGKFFLAACSE